MRFVWGVCVLLLICAVARLAPAPAPAGAAGPTTVTFTETGAHTFTVPAGVTSIHVVAVGAPGGNGNVGFDGGRGGVATADVLVTPGRSLTVVVGSKGIDGSKKLEPSAGGFNGGAPADGPDGGGGGASDIRTSATDLESRLVVAGGGGGGGGNEENRVSAGGDAGQAAPSITNYCSGGGGGTATAPGAGGNAGFPGKPGTLGSGGEGNLGGGGGGGLFGGGGGGGFNETFNQAACGGGGGSSGFGPGTSNTSVAVSQVRTPSVTISYVVSTAEPGPTPPGSGGPSGGGPSGGGASGANLSLPSIQHGKAVVGTVRIPANRTSMKAQLFWQKGGKKPLLFGKLVEAGLKKGLHSFTVNLNGAGKRKLSRLGKLRLTLSVKVIPPTGSVLAAAKKVTLKP